MTPSTPASLLARAATPEDLEAIRLTSLEKMIDLELILDKWQVSRLEKPWGSTPLGPWRCAAWCCVYPGMSRMSAKGYLDYLPAVRLRAASKVSLMIRAETCSMARLIPWASPWGVFPGIGERIR